MRRFLTPALILGCVAALTLLCYGGVLLRGEQFGYRDASHFYYPLYQRVQAEWEAKRWPLWEPEENGGMPLLGNPTAAVLYPGKLIFAAVSYPVGVRLYVVAHTLLAFAAMLALMRSWGTSWTGSALAALAYGFGAPILFQYCNIIYLVGAAWVPLGFRAVNRWLRLGRRVALLELAAVLAMETLGGDPESAYLTGLCAAGYAVMLVGGRARKDRNAQGRGVPAWVVIACGVLLLAAWVVGTLVVAVWVPILRPVRPTGQPPVALPWIPWVAPAVAAAWGMAGLVLLARWRRRRAAGDVPLLVPMLAGLVASAVLAASLSSAQLLPVMEFTGQSARAAGDGPHDIYPFSLEPARVVEFLWPNLFGTPFHGNRAWVVAVPPADKSVEIWVPSLYIGGLTLVLALSMVRSGSGRPWRGWMSAIVVISLLASFGEFTSPLWWARLDPSLVKILGPHDPPDTATIRFDRYLRDGDGGLYWFLATALPGFRQFRFPSKLLTFTVLGLAALAGQGWDDLASGDPRTRRRTVAWSTALLGVTLFTLAASIAESGPFVAWLKTRASASSFGPFEPLGAVAEMQRGLVQAVVVFAIALVLALRMRADRRPGLAAAVVLTALTVDLAAANARYVLTVPQALYDSTPEVVAIIRAAEKASPSPGPYRVHRMPIWNPLTWRDTASTDRVRDFVEWEHATIQPKYGITHGVQYTMTMGVAELYDYEWFFGGFTREQPEDVTRSLGVAPRTKVVVYPRRPFDMWNTRYFVLPAYANKWTDEHRGFASLLDMSEPIFPAADAFLGPDGQAKKEDWLRKRDFQVRRNLQAYPRAWVVHDARSLKPITGLNRSDRDLPMQEILYSNEPLWREANRAVYDPLRLVWVDEERRGELAPYLSGGETRPTEAVTVTRYEPDRVELDVTMDRPGVVVLADVYYPGWSLTIDGKPARIYRANRMMRGAAVFGGRHTLVYTYWPASFRIGLIVSCAALAVFVLLALGFIRHPISPTLAPAPDDILTGNDHEPHS
jgi:hypothetical protein